MRPSIPPHSSAQPATRALLPLVIFVASIALAVAQTGALHAQIPEPAYSESQAQGIDRMIMCPICPAETIDQAQVQISIQMRQIIRDMLSQGSTRDEILDFFVDRYGNDILAAPPKSGANLVAWLAPVGAVAAAVVVVFFILRSMTRRDLVLATPRLVRDPGLIPYLQLVDRHLDMTRTSSEPAGTSNQPCPGVESPGTSTRSPEENG